MRLLKRKTVNDICKNAISAILFQAENFLHGDVTYNDFVEVTKREYYTISKVGGKKWTKIADDVVQQKIRQGIKEVDTDISIKGDKNE